MAASKHLVAWIVFALAILGARADARIEAEASDSPPSLEVEQLRSKIAALESSISAKTRELKSKEEGIERLERIIQEKSVSIASLQSSVESLQEKGSVNLQEAAGKASARSAELEKQVEKLKSEIEAQSMKRDALEAQATGAEKKLQEMNLKLENLQKTINEQKRRIQKTDHALKVAEEDLMRAQLEATSKSNELNEVHGAWLPPWLATHIYHFQNFASSCWNVHVKPATGVIVQKILERSAQAQEWVQPYLETAKTKWIPAVREQIETLRVLAEPYVQKMTTKAIEVYEVSKVTITPYIINVQELAVCYLQEVQKFSKPYIDHAATFGKPHIKKLRVAVKPYTKRALRVYRKFLKLTTNYHIQVQASIEEKLKKHEATKPLATKEFAWLMASALLTLPVYFLYRLLSAIFCKKTRRTRRNAHANNAHRRSKRRVAVGNL